MSTALFGIFLGFLYVSMSCVLWESCDMFGRMLGVLGIFGMVIFLAISAVETNSAYVLFWFGVGYLLRFVLYLIELVRLLHRIRVRKVTLEVRGATGKLF